MVVVDMARGDGRSRDRGSCSLLQFQLYTKSGDVAANCYSHFYPNFIPPPQLNTQTQQYFSSTYYQTPNPQHGRLHDMTSICGGVLRSLTQPTFIL